MHVILTHEQADFDALGALLGAALLNESALPVLPRRINRNARAFLMLYGADLPFIDARDLPGDAIESVTLVDTQSLVTLKGMTSATRVHVVDHHMPRPDFSESWTITGERTGACTTLLVENLREHNGALSAIHATLLLLGIYEDTGTLTYVSTTPRDVKAAAFLLECGASLRIANEFLNPPLSGEQRQLYEKLLQTAVTHTIRGQKILVACTETANPAEEVASVAHKLRDTLDPDALFLLFGSVEGVRMVARSTTDSINVAEVAAYFGGGGHERASAALLHLPLAFAHPTELTPPQAVEQELLRILPQIVRPSITVSQLMSKKPILIGGKTSVHEAARLMQKYGYEGYPVVENNKILGLLTRRAVDRAAGHKLNLPAERLMQPGEVFIYPGDDLEALQKIMVETGWGQVPVVDPDTHQIIGIVTRTDLLNTLAGGEARLPGRVNLASRLDTALPSAHLSLLKAIVEQAHLLHQAAYVVGGFARDLLMDRPSLDFDVVVEGDAIALGDALLQNYGGRTVAHSRFGTAKWWIAEVRPEIAARLSTDGPVDPQALPASIDLISARTEFYEYPTALPTVERSSIKLDLHRRDFSINTMAIRLDGRHYGDLYDFWGGLNDLKRGLVRVLHSLSFVDDPTRMLRAVRFEQRFGFKIEERTLQLMDEARELIRQVSRQRLRHELDLILAEEKALSCLARLEELGLLKIIHPDLPWDGQVAVRLASAMDTPPDPGWRLPAQVAHMPTWRALAYLAWLGGLPVETARETAGSLRLPAVLIEALEQVCRLPAELTKLAALPASQVMLRLEGVPVIALCSLQGFPLSAQAAEIIRKHLIDWQHVQPVTNGEALRHLGIPQGPAYREILTTLRAAWLDQKVNSPAEEKLLLAELVKRLIPG